MKTLQEWETEARKYEHIPCRPGFIVVPQAMLDQIEPLSPERIRELETAAAESRQTCN